MNGQRTFIDDLKYQFRNGGWTIRLIFINVSVFLLITILLVFARLMNSEGAMQGYLLNIFSLRTSFYEFITHPWGLFTSIFAHFGFLHILFNMIVLYFSGRIFEQLFDNKRLIYTYVLGGLAGGILEVLAHFLPALADSDMPVVGASGAIMAIFFAIAFHRPKMKVYLFGILPVQIIVLAAVFFLVDFFRLGTDDFTAHFAHIGGALLGMISVQNLHSSGNIITATQNAVASVMALFKPSGRSGMYVDRTTPRRESDEEFAVRKKKEQEEVNRILDKISRSGYESLTKQEKDFLFNQSRK